ncbi:hypothetical protein AXG93_4008s1020 [Marchantia polymorpha subsp. ruderalis]|uniref:CCHC-type domain-containing protein n=1 Tax=Marchantia polymorpha subsp. ruderalis TaxID=1480154 RepID=A0A176W953_MARPO|nr:hypothetical protein AXG93_4008s1020 [Marchantia polymorpha subsp. ruderalis]
MLLQFQQFSLGWAITGWTEETERSHTLVGRTLLRRREYLFRGGVSSSEEEKKKKKRASRKKKRKRMAEPKKGSSNMVSKVETLVKDIADLKVHVVGVQDRRKSPASEDAAYAIQSASCTTPIQPVQIPRFAPREMATTLPKRRMAPPEAYAQPATNACYNCGEVGHFSPNCPHPRRPMGYVPMYSNCVKQGHTTVECDQPQAPRPTVRFVTPPNKNDVQVNQVDLSPEKNQEEDVWPKEEVMCGKVETRSAKCLKENLREVHKRGWKTKGRGAKGEKKGARRSDTPILATPSEVGKTPLEKPVAKVDEASVQILRRDYIPDIKDEVSELLKEALRAKTPSENRKTYAPSADPPTRAE